MKKILKTLVLSLFPQLAEILNARDRLNKENIELKRRIQILENSKNKIFEEFDIKSEDCFQYSLPDEDFSVKVFDFKTIPGKN